jgi:transposase
MQLHSVGIDFGKTTFHLVATSAAGKVLLRKKFTHKQLITFTANMQNSLIGMEACSGAHFLGRILQEQGHDVKLIPTQFVKPFVKSNKNDFLDAEAIAEAVDRENMRFCSYQDGWRTINISCNCTLHSPRGQDSAIRCQTLHTRAAGQRRDAN